MKSNIQKKHKTKWKDERGAMIVEASYVFPITFFVIFLLIYFGNLLYMRAAIASYTADAAVLGASYCANPWLEKIEKEGVVPTTIPDIQPYRGLNVINGNRDYIPKIENALKSKIEALGGGFFAGMEAEHIECKAQYKNYVVTGSFSVSASCRITMPIKFLGENAPWNYRVSAYEKMSVMEGCEIVRNVDMAMDYIERSKTAQDAIAKVQELFTNAKDFFNDLLS